MTTPVTEWISEQENRRKTLDFTEIELDIALKLIRKYRKELTNANGYLQSLGELDNEEPEYWMRKSFKEALEWWPE